MSKSSTASAPPGPFPAEGVSADLRQEAGQNQHAGTCPVSEGQALRTGAKTRPGAGPYNGSAECWRGAALDGVRGPRAGLLDRCGGCANAATLSSPRRNPAADVPSHERAVEQGPAQQPATASAPTPAAGQLAPAVARRHPRRSIPNAPRPDEVVFPVYPSSQFLSSYDAGRGQRYLLYGTTAASPRSSPITAHSWTTRATSSSRNRRRTSSRSAASARRRWRFRPASR